MAFCRSPLLLPAPRFTVLEKLGIRFRRMWECISSDWGWSLTLINFQIRTTISKLQTVVCSDGRFRVLREALHRCDPPCIPYLGMYLTDLSFIEEGTPDFTPDGLLNFSKMRMVRQLLQSVSTIHCLDFRLRTSYERFATSSKRHTRSITFPKWLRICSTRRFSLTTRKCIKSHYELSRERLAWVFLTMLWYKQYSS